MHDRDQFPPGPPTPNLRAATSRARVEQAERAQAVAELRGAELARLEILRDAIEPVLAQIPEEVDMFDIGLAPGPHPRLFVDMIAFVEMAHDKRRYRFVQDTRHGRVLLAESEQLEAMTEAITAYIARRLVDREKALASSKYSPVEPANLKPAEAPARSVTRPASIGWRVGSPPWDWVGTALRFLLEYLGIAALCVLVWVLLRNGYACGPLLPR